MHDVHDAPEAETDTYRYVDPIWFPELQAEELATGTSVGSFLESGREIRIFQRRPAAFLDDPDDVGLFRWEQVAEIPYWYPAAFTAAANDCRLVGYRTLLSRGGGFFTDEAYAESGVFGNYVDRLSRPDEFSNEATGLKPAGQRGCFHFHRGDRREVHIEGSSVVLCSDEPKSYGSFLFRVLPKVLAIRKLGLTHLPCIVQADQQAYRDLLILSGLPDSSIVLHDMNAVTRLDRAIVPCLRNTHGYLDPETCELYAELRATYGTMPAGRRIYVSRLNLNQAGWSTRVMVNEGELIERLAGIGFEIVTPEHLSVREQIAAFAAADLVVGPSGSNMYNTMFCRPGTKVIDIQSEPQWIYSYTGMYSSLGLDYGIFVGKCDPADTRPVHRRWAVNIEALISRIASF